MYNLLQLVFRQLIIICLTTVIIYACSEFEIPEHLVEKDVKQIIKKEIGNSFDLNIISSVPGEGDADTIYQYVKFDLVARYDQHSQLSGWLTPRNIFEKQVVKGGEMIICYQYNHGSWKLIKYWINKIPS